MRAFITIIIFFISIDSFSQTASSKPLSAIVPDSLLHRGHHSTGTPGDLPSAKPLPAIALKTKKTPGRPVDKRELPGNTPLDMDKIKNKRKQFVENKRD